MAMNPRVRVFQMDENPYRHQIVEIPPIEPIVIEHCIWSMLREPKWLRRHSLMVLGQLC